VYTRICGRGKRNATVIILRLSARFCTLFYLETFLQSVEDIAALVTEGSKKLVNIGGGGGAAPAAGGAAAAVVEEEEEEEEEEEDVGGAGDLFGGDDEDDW